MEYSLAADTHRLTQIKNYKSETTGPVFGLPPWPSNSAPPLELHEDLAQFAVLMVIGV